MKKKIAMKKRLFAPCSHCVEECTHQPIQVLIVKPHLRPYGATICPSLRSMQDIVGGCIQVVHDGLLKDDAVIVCNEEGKLACVECMDCIRGLPANRALRDSRSKVQDVICGTFMVVGTAGEDFTSLTPRQFADWTVGRACCVYRLIAPSALCASASRGAHSDRKRSTCCAQRPV